MDCLPHARCRQDRTCPTCARIRQARIADRAETIFAGEPATYLTVITPDPERGLSPQIVRRRFLRNNRPYKFLWTIETGAQAGKAHFNIITCDPAPRLPRGLPAHHSKIRTSARVVAAYISKQAQRPDPETFTGETFGACGPLVRALLNQRISIPVAALTAAHVLTRTNTVNQAAKTDPSARETARRALARCRSILRRYHAPDPAPPETSMSAAIDLSGEGVPRYPTHGRARQ